MCAEHETNLGGIKGTSFRPLALKYVIVTVDTSSVSFGESLPAAECCSDMNESSAHCFLLVPTGSHQMMFLDSS